MRGISYIKDKKNRKKAVVIDLKMLNRFDEQIENLFDIIIAEARKDEPSTPWSEAKKRLRKNLKKRKGASKVMHSVLIKKSAEKEISRLPDREIK